LRIAGIHKTSTVDFPGVLSAVLFTPGCNYHCFYCHNRQLREKGDELDLRDIISFLQKRAGLLEGIVVSGGEPTLQEDLPDFIAYIKKLGYTAKLDTNGSNPGIVEELLSKELLDYVALDYKAPFEMYPELCGLSADGMRATAKLLLENSVDWEMRTTLIPLISPEKLREMAQAVPKLPKYVLQQYDPQPGDMRYTKTLMPYSTGEIRQMAEDIRGEQPNVTVLGC